jgi:hypothetical protein
MIFGSDCIGEFKLFPAKFEVNLTVSVEVLRTPGDMLYAINYAT